MNKSSYSLALFISIFLPFIGHSATYFSRISGNWNIPGTWSTVSCSGVPSITIPGAADNVVICSGRIVDMTGSPGTCFSLTINGTANWLTSTTTNVGAGGLTLNNGALVSGVTTGSLIVAGPLNVPAGASVTVGRVVLNVSGLTSISGSFNDNNSGGSNTFANVTLNLGGSFNNTSAETYTITGNLDTYGGDFFATGATPTFNIAGNFNVISNTCDVSRIRLTVSGTTTVSGTLAINTTRGTKTFNNLIVSSTGIFNSNVAEDYRINGNIQSDGTFNANMGIFTLAGLGKTISGTSAIVFDDVTCTGIYTNNAASVRVMTSFRGTGTWNQGALGTVNIETINASFSVANFNCSTVGNTVIYNRNGAQDVRIPTDGSYSNLAVSGGNTKSLVNATTLKTNLLISATTTLATSNNNLLVGGNFTNNGIFTAGSSTVTLNGTLAQTIGGTASTAFNNLTITNASAIVTGATNFSVSTLFNLSAAATIFSPNATVIVSGGGTLTGNGTARVTRIAATPDFISQYTITGKTLAGLNIDFIGAGNQTVNILNYGSLTISTNGARTVTFPAAVVGVSNVFSPTAITTTYVITGNTINFNGTVAQTIPAFNYNHLTSSSTGTRTLAPAGTIGVAGVFTPSVNVYTITGSTINFNGTIAQNIPVFNYYNLSSSSTGSRTLPAVGTVGIAAAFLPGTNLYTITGSTVDFNGTVSQTIPAFNFNHLTSSSTGARTLAASGTIGVAGVFTPSVNVYTVTGSTVDFNGTVAQTIPAFNYHHLTSSSTGGRTLAAAGIIGVAGVFTPSVNAYTITGSTVDFNGTGSQTIPAFNFNHLTSSSTGARTLAAIGIIRVAGVFTPSTNVYTVTGSTVEFNGTVAQTVPAFNYNHLTSSSTGARTLAPAGTIGVAGVFTPSVNVYTITGSTINFNGTVAQGIPAFNYYNLSSSSTGSRTLAAVGTIGIAAAFVPGTNSYTVTNSTVNINGTIAQAIPAFTYHNLISAGSAAKTLSGNIIVNNDLTITSNLDASVSNYSISVKRNWINNGTFTAQNGAVVFNGSVAQTLSGAGTTTFHQLDINNTSGGVAIASGAYILNSVLTPTNGSFNTAGNSFTMISTATSTARIAPKGATASMSGNFIIQRYISGRDTSYADLSSTVQATNLLDWDNELPAISYIHTPPFALASSYTYDETLDTFLAITSSSTALTAGKGYEVFLSGDYSYGSLPNTTMNAIGVPNQGTQNLSSLISNNAQGWNLVGNPFASSVSWASIYAASGGASSGLYDFIEMYDYTIGDWNGYTSGDGIEIGSGQGFWVYGLPGATSLTLIVPESSKTTASNSTIKAPTKLQPYFTLKISSNANNFSHTFKVDAKENASDEFDAADLPFRASPNKATPALYSTINSTKVNLNTFNAANKTHSMPLTIKVNAMGNYAITAAGFSYMEEYECIQLEDKLKNQFIHLTTQNVYEFEMYRLEDSKRFVLHFFKDKDCKQSANTAAELVYEEDNTVEVLPSNTGNILNFNYSENTQVLVSVFNVLGQDIIEESNFTVARQSETVQLPDNYKGLYFIRIASDKGTVIKKFFKK